MIYLLDTNVVSETRRPSPNQRVMNWLDAIGTEPLRISVLTIGEIAKGVEGKARRDPAAGAALRQWLAILRREFDDRLIGIDVEIAEAWGQLAAARTRPVIDGLLAATARVRGMTLVTRNLRDFEGTGVATLNPWEA